MSFFFKPNIEKMKSLRDIDGLTRALHHKDAKVRDNAKQALIDLFVSQLRYNGFLPSSPDKSHLNENDAKELAIVKRLGELQSPQIVLPFLLTYAYNLEQKEKTDGMKFSYNRGAGDGGVGAICDIIPKILKSMGEHALHPLIDALAGNEAVLSYVSTFNSEMSRRSVPILINQRSAIESVAINVLVAIGMPAVEPLIALLKHDGQICRAAAKALGRIGDVRAIEPLVAALERGNKYDVTEALDRLGWKKNEIKTG